MALVSLWTDTEMGKSAIDGKEDSDDSDLSDISQLKIKGLT